MLTCCICNLKMLIQKENAYPKAAFQLTGAKNSVATISIHCLEKGAIMLPFFNKWTSIVKEYLNKQPRTRISNLIPPNCSGVVLHTLLKC